jgi:two-component system response regulator DesR
MSITILVADDHLAVADSFRLLLEQQGWDTRVAHSPGEAEAVLQTWISDIALLDIEFKGSDRTGFDIARFIGRAGLSTRAIFISMHNDAAFLECSRNEGAAGFLVKSSPSSDIIEAIRIVAAGGTWFPPPAGGHQHDGLPDQERRIIQHLARGLGDKEIARKMGIKPRTVVHHVQVAKRHTGAKTRIELLRMYFERALHLLPFKSQSPRRGGGGRPKPKNDDD